MVKWLLIRPVVLCCDRRHATRPPAGGTASVLRGEALVLRWISGGPSQKARAAEWKISAIYQPFRRAFRGAQWCERGAGSARDAYVISEADAITDLTAIKQYGEKVPETLAPFNGHYHFVVGGGKTQSLEGEAPTGFVVIAFDSAEQALAWYNSPAYQAIKPIRQSAVKGRIFIVESVAPQ